MSGEKTRDTPQEKMPASETAQANGRRRTPIHEPGANRLPGSFSNDRIDELPLTKLPKGKSVRRGLQPVETTEKDSYFAGQCQPSRPLWRGTLLAGLGILVLTFLATITESTRAEAPKGFVPLFNGKDLSGWKGLVANPKKRAKMSAEDLAEAQRTADEGMRAHWQVVDGALEFDGKGDSLCTEKNYADFELYIDWKITPGGDSGIYLRGTPQVQIWDVGHEPFRKYGAEKGSGALWNNQHHSRFPLVKADKPIGEWNTFYIEMVGERVTVKLNGKLVVDHVVLENYWERDKPLSTEGSIELQNHGNQLWFKNLYLRELSIPNNNTTSAGSGTVSPNEGVVP